MREGAQHQASLADAERQQQAREGLERWWAMSARLSQEALLSRATTAEEFNDQFAYCMANKGPHLIEAII